jgi:two-component system NtrC family response regulator
MKLAIVDDDINFRKSLQMALGEYEEYELVLYKSAKDALKKLDDSVDLNITDINMPGMDGVEFLRELNGKYEAIMITANASLNRAVEALRLGAKDFLTKPFEIEDLVKSINRAKIVANVKLKSSKNTKTNQDGFIGSSASLDKIKELALRASKTDAPIVLLGESGVGKEVFASFIHSNSNRFKKPFIALNMAAIPENLLESELFGFEKGAFTDATETKIGKFEASNGGTIFLDEIGEMPYALQAKLLRVLQEKEVTRLGSTKSIKLDIRVISATNADLKSKIKDNNFREDLYYRLSTIPITIAPLRNRIDEIIQIAEYTLETTIKKYGLQNKRFSKEAISTLLDYRWPGNIRELLSVVERASILSEGDEISKDDLFLDSRDTSNKKESIASMEEELIREVLSEYDLKESAKILGMTTTALDKKIKKYEIKLFS